MMLGRLKRRAAYDKGVRSEDMAAAFLKREGYRILEQRYKTKFGEIDLVVLMGDLLVFVEVKARKSFEEGVEAVHYRARRRIEKAALYFMAMHEAEYLDYGMRFDVIVVSPSSACASGCKNNSQVFGALCLDHLDNAWEAGQ